FFSTIPRPPCSPLLPYTTLFRSSTGVQTTWPYRPEKSRRSRIFTSAWFGRSLPEGGGAAVEVDGVVEVAAPGVPLAVHVIESREDRKSTRLNSSHDQISYAVFCL